MKSMMMIVLMVVGLVSAGPVLDDVPDGALCDLCTAGITQFQNLLSDTFVSGLKKAMSWGCWFSSIDDCSEKSAEVIDGMVTFIKGIDAHHMCAKISDCVEDESGDDIFDYVDDKVCDACVAQYDNFHQIIKDNPQIKSNIKSGINTMCFLPNSVCDSIKQAVDEAFDELEEDSKVVCHDIGLC